MPGHEEISCPGHEEIGCIRLGVSACLLGQPVRYDGGHKRDPYLIDVLSRYVDFVPVCPEVEAGFGVPREAMRLVGDPAGPRLLTVKTRVDLTERMREYAERRVEELAAENLCGFVFKSKSPSSGMARVKVYPEAGGVGVTKGVGLFAKAFMDRFPLLPVEEEGRLHDPQLRENFIERLFCMRRWQLARERLLAGGSIAPVVEYHSRHKYLLLSHSTVLSREMGALVAGGAAMEPAELAARYENLLLRTLSLLATPAKHVNVLTHMMGHLKRQLSPGDKAELMETFDLFKRRVVPLIVPITLLRHHARTHGEPYLLSQAYLDPHPVELQLRNHV